MIDKQVLRQAGRMALSFYRFTDKNQTGEEERGPCLRDRRASLSFLKTTKEFRMPPPDRRKKTGFLNTLFCPNCDAFTWEVRKDNTRSLLYTCVGCEWEFRRVDLAESFAPRV